MWTHKTEGFGRAVGAKGEMALGRSVEIKSCLDLYIQFAQKFEVTLEALPCLQYHTYKCAFIHAFKLIMNDKVFSDKNEKISQW